ncbi:hypothetical protein H4582DRAFT_1599084 [Lactarius indigo]|nr:hypothetical protein H4582DRAFT_1599084 [Lactarius indigo]
MPVVQVKDTQYFFAKLLSISPGIAAFTCWPRPAVFVDSCSSRPQVIMLVVTLHPARLLPWQLLSFSLFSLSHRSSQSSDLFYGICSACQLMRIHDDPSKNDTSTHSSTEVAASPWKWAPHTHVVHIMRPGQLRSSGQTHQQLSKANLRALGGVTSLYMPLYGLGCGLYAIGR